MLCCSFRSPRTSYRAFHSRPPVCPATLFPSRYIFLLFLRHFSSPPQKNIFFLQLYSSFSFSALHLLRKKHIFLLQIFSIKYLFLFFTITEIFSFSKYFSLFPFPPQQNCFLLQIFPSFFLFVFLHQHKCYFPYPNIFILSSPLSPVTKYFPKFRIRIGLVSFILWSCASEFSISSCLVEGLKNVHFLSKQLVYKIPQPHSHSNSNLIFAVSKFLTAKIVTFMLK